MSRQEPSTVPAGSQPNSPRLSTSGERSLLPPYDVIEVVEREDHQTESKEEMNSSSPSDPVFERWLSAWHEEKMVTTSRKIVAPSWVPTHRWQKVAGAIMAGLLFVACLYSVVKDRKSVTSILSLCATATVTIIYMLHRATTDTLGKKDVQTRTTKQQGDLAATMGEALTLYHQCIELDPENTSLRAVGAETHQRKAVAHIQAGEFAEARAELLAQQALLARSDAYARTMAKLALEAVAEDEQVLGVASPQPTADAANPTTAAPALSSPAPPGGPAAASSPSAAAPTSSTAASAVVPPRPRTPTASAGVTAAPAALTTATTPNATQTEPKPLPTSKRLLCTYSFEQVDAAAAAAGAVPPPAEAPFKGSVVAQLDGVAVNWKEPPNTLLSRVPLFSWLTSAQYHARQHNWSDRMDLAIAFPPEEESKDPVEAAKMARAKAERALLADIKPADLVNATGPTPSAASVSTSGAVASPTASSSTPAVSSEQASPASDASAPSGPVPSPAPVNPVNRRTEVLAGPGRAMAAAQAAMQESKAPRLAVLINEPDKGLTATLIIEARLGTLEGDAVVLGANETEPTNAEQAHTLRVLASFIMRRIAERFESYPGRLQLQRCALLHVQQARLRALLSERRLQYHDVESRQARAQSLETRDLDEAQKLEPDVQRLATEVKTLEGLKIPMKDMQERSDELTWAEFRLQGRLKEKKVWHKDREDFFTEKKAWALAKVESLEQKRLDIELTKVREYETQAAKLSNKGLETTEETFSSFAAMRGVAEVRRLLVNLDKVRAIEKHLRERSQRLEQSITQVEDADYPAAQTYKEELTEVSRRLIQTERRESRLLKDISRDASEMKILLDELKSWLAGLVDDAARAERKAKTNGDYQAAQAAKEQREEHTKELARVQDLRSEIVNLAGAYIGPSGAGVKSSGGVEQKGGKKGENGTPSGQHKRSKSNNNNNNNGEVEEHFNSQRGEREIALYKALSHKWETVSQQASQLATETDKLHSERLRATQRADHNKAQTIRDKLQLREANLAKQRKTAGTLYRQLKTRGPRLERQLEDLKDNITTFLESERLREEQVKDTQPLEAAEANNNQRQLEVDLKRVSAQHSEAKRLIRVFEQTLTYFPAPDETDEEHDMEEEHAIVSALNAHSSSASGSPSSSTAASSSSSSSSLLSPSSAAIASSSSALSSSSSASVTSSVSSSAASSSSASSHSSTTTSESGSTAISSSSVWDPPPVPDAPAANSAPEAPPLPVDSGTAAAPREDFWEKFTRDMRTKRRASGASASPSSHQGGGSGASPASKGVPRGAAASPAGMAEEMKERLAKKAQNDSTGGRSIEQRIAEAKAKSKQAEAAGPAFPIKIPGRPGLPAQNLSWKVLAKRMEDRRNRVRDDDE